MDDVDTSTFSDTYYFRAKAESVKKQILRDQKDGVITTLVSLHRRTGIAYRPLKHIIDVLGYDIIKGVAPVTRITSLIVTKETGEING